MMYYMEGYLVMKGQFLLMIIAIALHTGCLVCLSASLLGSDGQQQIGHLQISTFEETIYTKPEQSHA